MGFGNVFDESMTIIDLQVELEESQEERKVKEDKTITRYEQEEN